MITNQKLTVNEDGTFALTNTCSAQSALDEARMMRELNPDGYFGDRNGECRILGTIPEEMFMYNPWLIMAKRAEAEGDMAKHQHYMLKFFELFPTFRGNTKTRYWRGSRAVLL